MVFIVRQKWILIYCLFFLINFLFSALPEPVTNLRVVEVRFRQVKLSWSVPISTEPISFYQIRVSSFLTLSNEEEWKNNSSNTSYPYRIVISTSAVSSGTTVYYNVTGLKNGVGYFFAIKSSTYTELPLLDDTTAWSLLQIGYSYQYRYALPQNNTPQQFHPIWPVASVVVTSQTILFDWDDAEDQDLPYGDNLRYEFYWSTDSRLQTELVPSLNYPVNVVFNLTTSYVEVPSNYFLDNTTYYWRVKVKDSENSVNWSYGALVGKETVFIVNHTPEPPSSFTLISPLLGSTVTAPVTFIWEGSFDPDPQDIVKYYLYISSQGQNQGFVLQVGDITWSSYTLDSVFGGFVENTTYWWYVKAKDIYGLESCSTTWWFAINETLEKPQPNFLLSPGTTIYENIHIIFTLNPTFYWTVSYDPDPYSKPAYQLFISSYSDTPQEINSMYYSYTIYATYFYLQQQLSDDTTYFWRVKIWDETYYPSEEFVWSSTVAWFYTCSMLNSAKLIFPQHNFTTSYLLLTFKWQPNFVGYELNFASQTLVYWTTNDTTTVVGLSPYTSYYIPAITLKNNSTYYWKVIAHSNSSLIPIISTESVVFKFYISNSSPSAFDLVSPSPGYIVRSSYVVVTWDNSVDDDPLIFYTVIYSTNNFLTCTSYVGITTTNFTVTKLQDNTTYYWYVKSVDPWGQTTLSNQTFYFVVNNIPEPPSEFNLISPSNNSLLTNTYTTFYWEPSFDPDPFESVSYILYISSDKEFTYISFSTKTMNTYFFLPKGFLQVKLTYYWVVVASSTGSGFTVSSSTFVFRIINTAPLGLKIISPQNYTLITSTPVVFEWNPAYDPQDDEFHYELYYTTYVDQFGSWLSTNSVVLSSTEYFYYLHQVVDDTTYYWYIVAVDTYNNVTSTGPFLFWTSYDNKPPTTPTIIQPVNNEVVKLPYIIKWSTATDPDLFDEVRYTLQISTDPEFTPAINLVSSVTTTSFKFYNFEVTPSTYYLKVVAFDKHGGINISSVNFYIQQYYVSISSPHNNEIINLLPIKFYFSKVEPRFTSDKISYKLVYSSYTDYKYKVELNLENNYYEVTTVPMYPSTYYWYVEVYYNDNYAGGSDTFSFVIPDIFPAAPTNLQASVESYGVILSWDKVNIDNLWGYRIYSGYELGYLNLINFTTATVYVDIHGVGKNLFYMVSSVNQFGNESKDNKYIRLYYNEVADVYLSCDNKLIFTITPAEKLVDVKIERLQEEETNKYVYVYKIYANKIKLNNFAEIRFVKPLNENGKYTVEYFDGYSWIIFPSEDTGYSIVIKTQYLGKYRLSKIIDELPDELTILGCSPKKRIITPNGDGKNDYIEFQYKPGSYIEGEIFDVNLQRICKLKRRGNEKNILYFDGKNDAGTLLPPGIYVYKIKTEQKVFTGTIVIKY